MKHKNKHLIFIVFASLVVVFVAIVYLYMYHIISVSTEKTVSLHKIIANNSIQNDNNKNYGLGYKTARDKWALIPDLFVEPSKVVVFMESIEGIGEQAGSKVILDSIDADNLDDNVPGKEGVLRAKVSATGSWSAIMRTLSLMEVLPYRVSLKNIRLDQYGDRSSKGEISGSSWKLSLDLDALMVVPIKNVKSVK